MITGDNEFLVSLGPNDYIYPAFIKGYMAGDRETFGVTLPARPFIMAGVQDLNYREVRGHEGLWIRATAGFRPTITLDGVSEDDWLREYQLATSLNRPIRWGALTFGLIVTAVRNDWRKSSLTKVLVLRSVRLHSLKQETT